MDNNSNYLDDKIKDKFNLFKGMRSQEEDQKIFDKVYDLCFEEMIGFLGENLSEGERDVMTEELDKNESDEDKTKLIQEFSAKIENFSGKLNARIDNFLDELVISSISPAAD